jgi:hypothetical protein
VTGRKREQPAPGSLSIEPGSGAPGALRKIRSPASMRLHDLISADRPVPVLVEVSEPGYRPAALEIRARITDTVLTGTVQPASLPDLDRDPGVVAVEITRPLDMID